MNCGVERDLVEGAPSRAAPPSTAPAPNERADPQPAEISYPSRRARPPTMSFADPSSESSAAAASASSVAAAAAAAAGAGAGASSAAPASSAAAAFASAPAGIVFVKRSGNADSVFAEVDIYAGDSVARLADRACAKFRWLVGADKVKLFLVPDGLERAIQHNLAREADVLVDANLCLATDALAEAGIRDHSCLLGRLSSPPAAAPGECARAARILPPFSPSRGARGACGTCERSRWGLRGVLTPFPPLLSFHPSQAAAGPAAARL